MSFETIRLGADIFKVHSRISRVLLGVVKKFYVPFSADGAITKLNQASPLAAEVVVNINEHPQIRDDAFRLLDDVLINHPRVFQNSFRCLELPKANGTHVEIPDEFRALAELDGDGLGKGEVLLPILLKNSVKWLSAGNAYDVEIDGQNWHIKDHRNADSTPMGRVVGTEELFKTPILVFISDMGINQYVFGTSDFKNNIIVEEKIKERYGCDLELAAQKFEDELQASFRASNCVGQVAGVLYLKELNKKLCFERIDVSNIYLHSNGGRGFKACSTPNRFVDAILHRAREEAKILKHKQEILERKRLRAQESVRLKIEKIQLKKIRAENREKFAAFQKKIKWKKIKAVSIRQVVYKLESRYEAAQTFAGAYNKHGTIKGVCEELLISSATAAKRKKLALSLGIKLNAPQRKVKNESRNRRRKHETLHQGTLGTNQASLEGERLSQTVGIPVGQEDKRRIVDDSGVRHEGSLGTIPSSSSPSQCASNSS